ncbi:hypothetical protein [Marinimicrobium agarilyticum]|uniref:hypothetical protein n=1 Tax=Marinimicrobium agarilyticum TaxID=306546 RepID=UPI0003FB6810|nr:hypothetical protein [Marinimicrobium agarilyticum]
MKFDESNPPSWRQIVDSIGVSERTARRWLKDGAPAHVVRLIDLEQRGRIIPESWPEFYRFNHRGYFETGSHHSAVTWQELTWLEYCVGLWHQSLEAIKEAQASIDYLSDKLPRADVIELEAHRERLRALERQKRVTVADALEMATRGR